MDGIGLANNYFEENTLGPYEYEPELFSFAMRDK